jgi:hypothetical protein
VKTLKNKIKLVKDDMLSRFPKSPHTIRILIWDDGTDSVECRYGNDEGTKLFTSTYYDDKLTFREIDINGKVMVIDEFGNEKFYNIMDNPHKFNNN